MLSYNWLFIYSRHYAAVVCNFLLRLFSVFLLFCAFGSTHAKNNLNPYSWTYVCIQSNKKISDRFKPNACRLLVLECHRYLNPSYFGFMKSRDSDWLRAGWPGGQSSGPGRVKNFLLFTSSIPARVHPTSYAMGTRGGALSPGVKLPGHEPGHLHPSRAEGRKMWIYTSTSPYAFMA
jgi:hypothetical protein